MPSLLNDDTNFYNTKGFNMSDNSFNITGELYMILPKKEFANFTVQEVLEDKPFDANGKIYHDYIVFSLSNDKIILLNGINIGDVIEVDFNVNGNKYEKDGVEKFFTSLRAWKVQLIQKCTKTQVNEALNPPPVVDAPNDDDDGAMPF